MKYSTPWLLEQIRSAQPLKYVFFWGHTPKVKGRIDHSCFSQWYPSPFKIGQILYPTAEHWMMACKARMFGDETRLQEILHTDNPGKAKALGRMVDGFDHDAWMKAAPELVICGNIEKFRQQQELGDFLLRTGDKILVEASPVDFIWGIGMAKDHRDVMNPAQWRGPNLLGFALMEVRDIIRNK